MSNYQSCAIYPVLLLLITLVLKIPFTRQHIFLNMNIYFFKYGALVSILYTILVLIGCLAFTQSLLIVLGHQPFEEVSHGTYMSSISLFVITVKTIIRTVNTLKNKGPQEGPQGM
jgi:hypothetical protein